MGSYGDDWVSERDIRKLALEIKKANISSRKARFSFSVSNDKTSITLKMKNLLTNKIGITGSNDVGDLIRFINRFK